jgi:hypothetical protein
MLRVGRPDDRGLSGILCGRAGGAAACGTVPELWKTPRTRFPQLLGRRTERAAHNGPQASFFSFEEKKKKNPYNGAHHSRRLIDNTDVLASLRSDHDGPERVITMLWNA